MGLFSWYRKLTVSAQDAVRKMFDYAFGFITTVFYHPAETVRRTDLPQCDGGVG